MCFSILGMFSTFPILRATKTDVKIRVVFVALNIGDVFNIPNIERHNFHRLCIATKMVKNK